MKTTIKTFVALLALSAFVVQASAQDTGEQVVGALSLFTPGSTISQYPSLHGTNEIIRANADNSSQVICLCADNQRSLFIVESGNAQKYFYTSEQFAPLGQNAGHEVSDMVIDGSTCWVCGRYWHETGQLVYNLDGSSYMEREYDGFIGTFNIDSVVGGGGVFETYLVSGTSVVSRIAKGGYSLAFVANDGELAGEAVPYVDGLSMATVTPPKAGEVFMDVVYAGSKYVFLSRFHNLGPYFNHYRVGLRYASPGYVANMQQMHVYDTWQLFHTYGRFGGLDPICLYRTNSGNGVAVSWVETDQDNPAPDLFGHLFTLKIDSEGATSFKGYYSTDDAVYTKIKDAGFGILSYNNPYITILLEDEDGNSVVRLFHSNCGNQNTGTSPMLSLTSPMLESVLPVQTNSTNLKFSAVGYYANEQYKVAEVTEMNVINHPTSWQNNNCMTYGVGYIYSDTDATPSSYELHSETDNKVVTAFNCSRMTYTLTVGNASASYKCYKLN